MIMADKTTPPAPEQRAPEQRTITPPADLPPEFVADYPEAPTRQITPVTYATERESWAWSCNVSRNLIDAWTASTGAMAHRGTGIPGKAPTPGNVTLNVPHGTHVDVVEQNQQPQNQAAAQTKAPPLPPMQPLRMGAPTPSPAPKPKP